MVELTVVIAEDTARYVVARAKLQKIPLAELAGEFVAQGLTEAIFMELKARGLLKEKMTPSQLELAFTGLYPVIGLKELSRKTGLSEGCLKTLADAGVIPGRAINPKSESPTSF